MRLQSAHALCGPASVANALRALGRNISEDKIADAVKKAGHGGDGIPEQDGTAPSQIQRALEAVGFVGQPWTAGDGDDAWHALRSRLLSGDPVLLPVDFDGDTMSHWLVAIGLLGDRVLVADGADPEIVVSYSEDQLRRRWKMDTDPARYYGMTIKKARRKK